MQAESVRVNDPKTWWHKCARRVGASPGNSRCRSLRVALAPMPMFSEKSRSSCRGCTMMGCRSVALDTCNCTCNSHVKCAHDIHVPQASKMFMARIQSFNAKTRKQAHLRVVKVRHLIAAVNALGKRCPFFHCGALYRQPQPYYMSL